MKIILSLFITLITLFADNVGFLMNQKYVCISQGVIIGNKLEKVWTKEESFKYPVRFYIDNTNTLHTDANKVLKHDKDNIYINDELLIALHVDNGKRYILFTVKKPLFIKSLYKCIETNNWTITK